MRFGVLVASLLVLASFLTTGCGSKAGKGIPKRVPCQVKVTKGGAPLAGVSVIMVCDALESGVNVSGETDANGVAEISTKRGEFFGKGAPEGDYKVLLSKPLEGMPEGKSPDELDAMGPDEKAAYAAEMEQIIADLPRDVPDQLGEFDATPLKATVSKANKEALAVEVEDFN